MNRFLVVVFTYIILTGCVVEGSTFVTSTGTPASTALSAPTIASVATLFSSATPTVSPEIMRYQCLEVTSDPVADERLKGVIVYNGDYNQYSFLSNQETNDTYLFPRGDGDILWEFGVSPDGRYIKYIHSSAEMNEDRLIIATAEGQPVWSQVTESLDWEWFDNERLAHFEFSEDGTYTFSLLNPFNGRLLKLPADFPDSELFNGDWYPNWNSLKIYDPTLTRVIYPQAASNEKQEWPIILLNMETNQIMTRIVTTDGWGGTPLWTPDGKQFIISTTTNPSHPGLPLDEFFAVSRDGVVRQLTYFEDYFGVIDILNSYSLSPNGKSIAFWILIEAGSLRGPLLAVLNIETSTVTNYCIQGDPFADNAAEPSEPIWSPDSTQVLVISQVPYDTKVRRVVVVDVVNNYAAQINQDVEPVGWMLAP